MKIIYKQLQLVNGQLVQVGQDNSYHRSHSWCSKHPDRFIGVRRVGK